MQPRKVAAACIMVCTQTLLAANSPSDKMHGKLSKPVGEALCAGQAPM